MPRSSDRGENRSAHRNRPGADSVRFDLDMDGLRAEPSPAGDVSLVVEAGPVRVTFSLTRDTATGLANHLTDAVDLLDGRCQ